MKTPVKTPLQTLSGVERHILESIVELNGDGTPDFSADVDVARLFSIVSDRINRRLRSESKYAIKTDSLTDVIFDLERAGLIVQKFTDSEAGLTEWTIRITPAGLYALRRASASWVFLYDYTFEEGENEIPGGVASFSRPTRYETSDPRYLSDSYIEVDYAGRIARVNPITDEPYPFERLDAWNERLDAWNARDFNRNPL